RNCHETTSAAEAREKLAKGMQILVREGTVSKDLAALAELITTDRAPFLALCTDDRNPLDIAEESHLDYLIRAAIARGVRPLDAYRAATWSAARHFGLFDRGLVAPGQRADIVLLEDLATAKVHSVICRGAPVTADRFKARPDVPLVGLDSVKLKPVTAATFHMPATAASPPVIGIRPGQILTDRLALHGGPPGWRSRCRGATAPSWPTRAATFSKWRCSGGTTNAATSATASSRASASQAVPSPRRSGMTATMSASSAATTATWPSP